MAGPCRVCRERLGEYLEYGYGRTTGDAILLCRQCAATWGLDLVKREHKTHLFLLKIVAQTLGWMISAMHRLGAPDRPLDWAWQTWLTIKGRWLGPIQIPLPLEEREKQNMQITF
jgi:hypothetical protein